MKVSKNGKTVTFEVSAWWSPKDNKFRLKGSDPVEFILTVSDNPSKERGHPKLFRELTKIMKAAGVPTPD